MEFELEKLRVSDNLIDSSKKQLDYLISIGEITHSNRESGSLTKRVTESGVSGLYSGEIIGFADSIEKLLELWKESLDHNSVMLDPRWNWFGVSIVKYEEVFVSVVNFSSGQLGSLDIWSDGNKRYINGLYLGEPYFDLDINLNLRRESGEFEIEIPAERDLFFIYVYDVYGNLTDQINIF